MKFAELNVIDVLIPLVLGLFIVVFWVATYRFLEKLYPDDPSKVLRRKSSKSKTRS